ncbi:MAG: hypothetical protein ICV73_29840 [Acetobacteraceae bacterium]|nr:hypothetical protein [Acetobacteraceae bacterium]
MWNIASAAGWSRRLRALPALARDLGASLVVLSVCAGAAAMPSITVPAAGLALLPALLLTAVAFGRDSALLAALLAALMARWHPLGFAEGSTGLPAIAVLSGAALAVAALVEELRRSRAEAETAYLRSDATARHAALRVEAARRELRQAKAQLAEAERNARQAVARDLRAPSAMPRTGARDPDLESAFRSEGGV